MSHQAATDALTRSSPRLALPSARRELDDDATPRPGGAPATAKAIRSMADHGIRVRTVVPGDRPLLAPTTPMVAAAVTDQADLLDRD